MTVEDDKTERECKPYDDVFVIVPAYNESARIGFVLQSMVGRCPHIVVIDDGSRDETSLIASASRCHVLRHVINRGQGAALQTGIDYALRNGARYIVTFDADGQHSLADLPAILGPLMRREADVTLGSRFLNSSSNVPRIRRAALRMATLFTGLVSGVKLTDCHNGLRGLTRKAASRIRLRQDRMAHASEIYDQIRQAKLSYLEVPVTIRYSRDTLAKGQSLWNSFSVLFQYFVGRFS